jgi:hypothetical protein
MKVSFVSTCASGRHTDFAAFRLDGMARLHSDGRNGNGPSDPSAFRSDDAQGQLILASTPFITIGAILTTAPCSAGSARCGLDSHLFAILRPSRRNSSMPTADLLRHRKGCATLGFVTRTDALSGHVPARL